MGKAPAFQFYPGDWRRDTQVQMASMETRGVWFEMLCCMWDAPERGKIEGTIERLAHLLGCTIPELERSLKEIEYLHIGNVTMSRDVTKSHNDVTIVNRRMSREESIRNNARLRKRRQRSREGVTPDVTLHSSSSSSITPIIPQKMGDEVPLEKEEKAIKVPYQEIRKLWIEILPELPRPHEQNSTWYKPCKARVMKYEKARELDWWKRFFEVIRTNPHWMGENDRHWTPDIGWFLKEVNFFKVITWGQKS